MAADFLQSKGFVIKHRNFRIGRAEVDIIAEHDNQVVFVEVKTRHGKKFGMPEEFVSQRQEKTLFDAAETYCTENQIDTGIRFDIVSIIIEKNETEITHFEDAFWPMA